MPGFKLMNNSKNTLKAIEGYLANKSDHGDVVAVELRKMLLPLLNPRKIISDLRSEGYAVVMFSPEELGTATAKSLENRLVELGNEAISDLQDFGESDVDDGADGQIEEQSCGEAAGEYLDLEVTMRSKTTFGVDKTTVRVWGGQSGREVAEHVAQGCGAMVEEIRNSDGSLYVEPESADDYPRARGGV